MTRMSRLAATALAAVAIVPATAQVANADVKATASASATIDVASHLKKASTATAKLSAHIEAGRDGAALKVLKVVRRETTTAARDARRLALRVTGDASAERAIWALTAAGAAQSQAAGAYVDLLVDTDGRLQLSLAGALPSSVASRDAVVQSLTTLLDKLKDPELQALASQALAALAAQTPSTLDELADIPVDQMPVRVANIVKTVMDTTTQAIDLLTQRMSALIPTLPTAAQAPMTQALASVGQILKTVTDGVAQMSTSIAGSIQQIITALKPAAAAAPNAGGEIDADVETAAQLDGSVDVSMPSLGSLIPNLTGVVPGFGGFINNLLGNLPFVGALLGGR